MKREDLEALMQSLAPVVRDYVDAKLRELPTPKDGTPGKEADPALIRQLVDAAVAALPKARDGEPGRNGAPGTPGRSVTPEELQPMLEALFSKSLLDYERRFGEITSKAVASIPPPKDGVDGLSIEDLTVEDDGEGNITLRFARGEISREHKLRLPCFMDRGVYREGEKYMKGHAVSFGGCLWLAQKDDAVGKPGDGSGDWRLAVKRGRDGKDGASPIAASTPVRVR